MEVNGSETEPPTTSLLLGEASAVDDGGIPAGDSAVSPLLLFSVFIAVSGSFAYGSTVGYSSPIESAVEDDLGLSTAQFSLFGSLLTAGGLLGSLLSGKIADLIGRRGAMGLSDILSLVGWIAISISKEAWLLDLGRSLVGVSVGLTVYVVPIYIAEITPKNLRGGLVSSSQLMISCGLLVMFFAGSLIPWRILVLIGIIPPLLQLLGIFLIPESPRFLAKLGHNKAQEIVLQRLRGDNIDVSQEAADIEVLFQPILYVIDSPSDLWMPRCKYCPRCGGKWPISKVEQQGSSSAIFRVFMGEWWNDCMADGCRWIGTSLCVDLTHQTQERQPRGIEDATHSNYSRKITRFDTQVKN